MRDKRNAIRVVLFQFGKVCCDPYLMALQVARKAFKSCLTFHKQAQLVGCCDVVWGNCGYIMEEFLTSRNHNHFLLAYHSVCATITCAPRKEVIQDCCWRHVKRD